MAYVGGGKGSDSDDDEPAAKKKMSPALVSFKLDFSIPYYSMCNENS